MNKIYLNKNRRITKYSRFQTLFLSLNVCWIKWRKVRVSLYVKVLHLPIIIFYWNFYSKELLNYYFTTAMKLYLDVLLDIYLSIYFFIVRCLFKYFVKVSLKILRHQIEFTSGFILLQKPPTNYPLNIWNFFYLAVSSFIFL